MSTLTQHASTLPQRERGGSEQLSGLRKRFVEDGIAKALSIDSVLGVLPGPDIQWHPSFETYQRRVDALSALRLDRPQAVPEGFPDKVEGPRAWSGADFANEDGFVLQLSEANVFEVERGLSYFKSTRAPVQLMMLLTSAAHNVKSGPDAVSKSTFPLPGLQSRLDEIARDLHHGRGFAVIRGLDPRRYSARDNLLIYLGITSYIAEHRAVQDSGGSMISMY